MPASLVHPTRAEGNAERKGWPAAEGTTTVSACPYACDGTPMTVRGGGIPRRPLALTPNGRMGPPLRSFAADAHDCIMVRVLGPTGYKVVARLNRAPKAGSPLIVIATALSVPSCSKHEGKRCAALGNSLTKKAPYKGPGADSEEKHEPTILVNADVGTDVAGANEFRVH